MVESFLVESSINDKNIAVTAAVVALQVSYISRAFTNLIQGIQCVCKSYKSAVRAFWFFFSLKEEEEIMFNDKLGTDAYYELV